jgi:hypothetical protein
LRAESRVQRGESTKERDELIATMEQSAECRKLKAVSTEKRSHQRRQQGAKNKSQSTKSRQ